LSTNLWPYILNYKTQKEHKMEKWREGGREREGGWREREGGRGCRAGREGGLGVNSKKKGLEQKRCKTLTREQ
jgi:hypothetical protein